MPLTRRDFLKLSSLAAAGVAATACSEVSRQLHQSDLPDELLLADPTASPDGLPAQTGSAAGLPAIDVDPVWRLLNRAGYGPRPGDISAARNLGLAAYLEQQLAWEAIDDSAADLYVRGLTLYNMEIGELVEQEARDAAIELASVTYGRALMSKRQLYEAMVEFWSDHFNIYVRKNQVMLFLKIVDDRDVIRPHALGKFRDLLWASAQSPAMMAYLDNVQNNKGEPNENYARELMELHTLGVDGGYDQQDVQELARALTGLHVGRRGRRQGQLVFNENQHDTGAKVILGETLPAGQTVQQDLNQLLELLVTHPSTARFIATKLVRRFVADKPPASLIDRVATTYQETDGDIKSMLRVIFLSEEFATAPPKLKRPYTFMMSALRALHVDFSPGRRASRGLTDWLNQMGQPRHLWPPPDGYPDVSAAWASNLLPRWNFSLALARNSLPGINVPLEAIVSAAGVSTSPEIIGLFGQIAGGRALDPATAELLTNYVSAGPPNNRAVRADLEDAVGLLFASPTFQWT
ncbi:MAG: DUF1800 domain-containing protein [Anaerolineales bacterium]|nr:DUF1800 domain-containing protein [Anaerolineales bacterium]